MIDSSQVQKIEFDQRLRNSIWQCIVCEGWHPAKVQGKVVMGAGAAPFQQTPAGAQMQMTMVLICRPCFKELDLSDSDIHVPSQKEVTTITKGSREHN